MIQAIIIEDEIGSVNVLMNLISERFSGDLDMLAYQRERKTFENNVRIADSAPVDYSYSWFIQFELKGLGGITNTISHILEESIQGYKESESNL